MEDNESNRYEKIKFLGEGQVRLKSTELDAKRGRENVMCANLKTFFSKKMEFSLQQFLSLGTSRRTS